MSQIKITKMTKEDLPGVFEVEKKAFPIPWPISSFEEELNNMLATFLVAKIEENDSVIFFNFRPDRAREITRAIVDPEFDGFETEYKPTYFVCMTPYDATLPNVNIAYPKE